MAASPVGVEAGWGELYRLVTLRESSALFVGGRRWLGERRVADGGVARLTRG